MSQLLVTLEMKWGVSKILLGTFFEGDKKRKLSTRIRRFLTAAANSKALGLEGQSSIHQIAPDITSICSTTSACAPTLWRVRPDGGMRATEQCDPFCRVEIKHAVQEDRASCADNVLSLRYRLKWMLLPRRSGTPY